MNGRGSATLRDVAVRAGVSLATASRVLNGSERQVSADLAERVFAAAAEMEYTPNASAQTMVRGRSSVVGLLVHDIADPYFSSIAAGVAEAAEDSGLVVVLGSTRARPEQEVGYVRALRELRGRGVILAGSRTSARAELDALTREVTAFHHQGGRVVAISQPRMPVDTLVIDNRAGATRLAEELAGLGYRRFGVLAGPPGLLTARDRCAGFQRGLARAGVAPASVAHGAFTRDGGLATMNQLLEHDQQLDCVFAVNDVMAMGALTACRSRGIDVPRDLAVAGFDDIATLRDVHPALTTVRLPLHDIGVQAFRLLDQTSPPDPRRVHVRGRVLVRESTPPRR